MPTERRSITQSFISSLGATTDGKDQFYRCNRLRGFGLRVKGKTGVVSFIVEGRVSRGPQLRETIGRADIMSLADARKLAEHDLRLMAEGTDPRQHRINQKEEAKKQQAHNDALDLTLDDIFKAYLRARTLRPTTERDYRYAMKYFADWGAEPIRNISRKKVEERFIDLRDNTGKATAAKAMRYLSAICNFAMADDVDGEQLLTSNPTDVLKQKKYDRAVPVRTDYLDDNQIHKLLHYAETVRSWPTAEMAKANNKDGVTDQGLNYTLLLLFTGLRKTEALRLAWADVDMVKKVFIARDTKNHSHHSVPMSRYVYRLFLHQRELAGQSPWVFPSSTSAVGHMTEPKFQLSKITAATGLSFRFHDLRRTFATHANIQGWEEKQISRALNHKDKGITAQYIQATVETLRPVFEAVARGYLSYFDEDLAKQIYEPEAYAAAEADHAEHMKETADRGTPTW